MFAAIASAPAYLNDFLYIRATTPSDWLIADYGSKALVLALVLVLPDTRRALAGAWRIAEDSRRNWLHSAAWVLAPAGLIVTAFIYLKPELDALAPSAQLFDYPDIDAPAVRIFDLTAGLALTAVVEELVFRALGRRVIEAFSARVEVVVVVSALAFALIHWSNGIGSLAVTFIAGVLLMALYLRSGSLWAPVAAHYAANLIMFL